MFVCSLRVRLYLKISVLNSLRAQLPRLSLKFPPRIRYICSPPPPYLLIYFLVVQYVSNTPLFSLTLSLFLFPRMTHYLDEFVQGLISPKRSFCLGRKTPSPKWHFWKETMSSLTFPLTGVTNLSELQTLIYCLTLSILLRSLVKWWEVSFKKSKRLFFYSEWLF